MSLMYPLHLPEVPLKWDDPAWIPQVPLTNEAALIKLYVDKVSKRQAKEQFAHFTDTVCNLTTADSDDDANDSDN